MQVERREFREAVIRKFLPLVICCIHYGNHSALCQHAEIGCEDGDRMFEDEEGVLQWGSPETRRKRGYITLRIPESVLHRVHQKRELRAG